MRFAKYDACDVHGPGEEFDAIADGLNQTFSEHIDPILVAEYGDDSRIIRDNEFRDWLLQLSNEGEVSKYIASNVTRNQN